MNLCDDIDLVCTTVEEFANTKGESFDLILHFELIEHLSDPFLFMQEAFRLLKNNGEMRVWLSDDNLKLPVKIEMKTNIGNLIMKLKDYNHSTN